jgi:hypothetical protein
MIEECIALFHLQEMDREVHEAIMAKMLEHGLHPPDGWDLSAGLN